MDDTNRSGEHGPLYNLFGGDFSDRVLTSLGIALDVAPVGDQALLHRADDYLNRGAPPGVDFDGSSVELVRLARDRLVYLLRLGSVAKRTDCNHSVTPLDVPGYLALCFGPEVQSVLDVNEERYKNGEQTTIIPRGRILTSLTGMTAVPFHLDAELAGSILSSRPPDSDLLADLRMPAQHLVIVLGAPYVVSQDSGWWSTSDLEASIEADLALADVARRQEDELGRPHQQRPSGFSTTFMQHGGVITGVMLHADENGFLLDEATWLVSTDLDHHVGPTRDLVSARISESALAPLVHNLAAAVAWGPWKAPEEQTKPIPDNIDDLEPLLNTGWLRRAVRNPANLGVRVIDVSKTRQSSSQSAGEPSGRHVSPHLRRGHWRSVRVATRSPAGQIIGDVHGLHDTDWHYEGRWVPPTMVNAGAASTDQSMRVYTIPPRSLFHDDVAEG
jgi:hypothetical protein